MASNNNNSEKLTMNTPIGTAYWAHVREPEEYEGNILGFSIMLELTEEEKQEIINLIHKEIEAYKKANAGGGKLKGKKWMNEPFCGLKEMVVDKETGETIEVFKFKTKHEYKTKTGAVVPKIVPIFDAQGKPLGKDILIGNGSKVKVNFTVSPYYMNGNNNGATLYLNAIQVIDLQTYGGGAQNAEGFGFEATEGYTCEESNGEAAGECFDNDEGAEVNETEDF